MKSICFLRPFRATRIIKSKFQLPSGSGKARQHFAFDSCQVDFAPGQKVSVSELKDGHILIVADNPSLGEVVLDGALEGIDFKVLSHRALPDSRHLQL